MSHRFERIDDLVIDTIMDVLLEVFGEKTFKKIFRFIKQNYLSDWENADFTQKLNIFEKALRSILGKGSIIVEDLILERLYSNLELELKWKKGYKFSDYINELQKHERHHRDIRLGTQLKVKGESG